MKQIYFSATLLLTLFISSISYSQQQLPNNDFENWTTYTVGVDDPPSETQDAIPYEVDSLLGGIWGSGNTLIDTLDEVGIDLFLKDTSYSYSGSHAALLRTQMIGPLPATGTLWTGFIGKLFDLNAPLFGAKTGIPFTDTPSNLKGYYDYKSVNGDSCRVECYMTKWNTSSNKRDTIGWGEFWTDQTSGGFEAFDVPMLYAYANPDPDTLITVFLSSYGGVDFRGQEGSTFIVDSVYFEYDPITVSSPEYTHELDVSVYANNREVIINAPEILKNASVDIYDVHGKLILSRKKENFKNKRILLDISPQYVIVKIATSKYQTNRKLFIKP